MEIETQSEKSKVDVLKRNFFKKSRRLWVHLTVYTVFIFALTLGCFITLKNYEKYQPIIMERTVPLTTQELIGMSPIETTATTIRQDLTEEQLSRLLFNKLKDYNPPIGKNVTLEAYYYDVKEEISYFNFAEDEKLYSLVARSELIEEDNKVVLSLSDFKLGKYKMGLLGKYYSQRLDITDVIEMDFNDLEEVIYINKIDINDGNRIICNYTYNTPVISKKIKSYREQLDNNKAEIYIKDDSKVKDFVEMLREVPELLEPNILTWMPILLSDKQVFEKCVLTLKDEGIKEICNDFQIFYNSTLQPEQLIEVSQNELNYVLMQYHRDFSKMLLNYLYQHRGYSYNNGQLVVGGSPINVERILHENGREALYDIEIVSSLEGISAYYNTGDVGVQKLILRKE